MAPAAARQQQQQAVAGNVNVQFSKWVCYGTIQTGCVLWRRTAWLWATAESASAVQFKLKQQQPVGMDCLFIYNKI
jgi:hypothetical protein